MKKGAIMGKLYDYPQFDSCGVKRITDRKGEGSEMLMDISVYRMNKGDEITFGNGTDETALLLLEGSVEYRWDSNRALASRRNVFDDGMYCLHIPRDMSATIVALENTELLCQATENPKRFEAKLYTPSDCQDVMSGEGLCRNTCVRLVRTAFDYGINPDSNMVIGEVITTQGNWSSYVPHHHPQPEVYYYKFDKPQGFGAGFVGDTSFKIKDGCYSAIPGGLTHPQVTAPGYRMYVCWMIRHLEGNPWTDRIDDPDHVWLYDYK